MHLGNQQEIESFSVEYPVSQYNFFQSIDKGKKIHHNSKVIIFWCLDIKFPKLFTVLASQMYKYDVPCIEPVLI